MGILGALLGPITSLVKGWFAGRLQSQQLKQKIELAKVQATLQHINNLDVATAAWNLQALKSAGWRPDYLTVVLSLPLIAVFVPPLVPYIERGFKALEILPYWYTAAVGAMVSSAFGAQKVMDIITHRKVTKAAITQPPAQPNIKKQTTTSGSGDASSAGIAPEVSVG